MDVNRWTDAEHSEWYLSRADSIPYRTDGEAQLLGLLPEPVERVLDLGCGDGRLLSLVLGTRPDAGGIAVDFSATMLDAARRRFEGNDRVRIVEHDLDDPLPAFEHDRPFDAVVSSFAIHHLVDERKRALYTEVFGLLRPGGVFCNLEHVASPTESLHHQFLHAVHLDPSEDDPSNKLVDVEVQLHWLRGIGFADVDCFWKWRELALLAGTRPI